MAEKDRRFEVALRDARMRCNIALRILASRIALHVTSDETVVLLGHHTRLWIVGLQFAFNKAIDLSSLRLRPTIGLTEHK